jgi:hypothetical protein
LLPLTPGVPGSSSSELRGAGVCGAAMPTSAKAYGQFEFEITALEPAMDMDGVSTGRNQVDKQFQGDLDGTSRGVMLTAMIPSTQSAAYVAIERVSCRLDGRRGSFVLQHTGSSTATGQKLVVTVVPGSGTGQLVGITGTMTIEVRAGNHSYTFDYSFGASG